MQGALGSPNAIVNSLVVATPLVLGGLSVALRLQGRPVQHRRPGSVPDGRPRRSRHGRRRCATSAVYIAIPAALVGGMLFGAVWGFIPGFLKAFSGAHEVVTTIMLNYIAASMLAGMVNGPLRVPRPPPPSPRRSATRHCRSSSAGMATSACCIALIAVVSCSGCSTARRSASRCGPSGEPGCGALRWHAAALPRDRDDVDLRAPGRACGHLRAAWDHPQDDLVVRDDRGLRLDRSRAAGPFAARSASSSPRCCSASCEPARA